MPFKRSCSVRTAVSPAGAVFVKGERNGVCAGICSALVHNRIERAGGNIRLLQTAVIYLIGKNGNGNRRGRDNEIKSYIAVIARCIPNIIRLVPEREHDRVSTHLNAALVCDGVQFR